MIIYVADAFFLKRIFSRTTTMIIVWSLLAAPAAVSSGYHYAGNKAALLRDQPAATMTTTASPFAMISSSNHTNFALDEGIGAFLLSRENKNTDT